jgi:hypothetical protein
MYMKPTISYVGFNNVSSTTYASMVYGGGRYVLFPNTAGQSIKYSTDGVTWSTGGTMPSLASGSWNTRAIWTGTTFFVVANSTTGAAFTTPDGVTLTSRTMPAVDNNSGYYGCCSNGSTLVALQYAASSGGAKVVKSTDGGATWTSSYLPVNSSFDFIAYGGGKYITAVFNSTTGYYSTDAVTWTAFTLPKSDAWETAVYNGSYWIMGLAGTTTTMAMSYDGINWFSIPTPNGASIPTSGLKWDGTYWYMNDGGTNAYIRYTSDVTTGWGTAYNIGGDFNGSIFLVASNGSGTFIGLRWNTPTWAAYKWTAAAGTTFTAGTAPSTPTAGLWFIKS